MTQTLQPAAPDGASAHTPRQGLGRFLGMTTLGALLPGSGLLLSGRRAVGGTLLACFVALIVGVCSFVLIKGPTSAALFLGVRPNLLLAVGGGIILGSLIWFVSVLATAKINWPTPPATFKRIIAALFTMVLSLALLAPAAKAVEYVFIHRDLVDNLFTTARSARSDNDPRPEPGSGRDAWENYPRVNLLLLGSDAYPGRPGLRTDSMIVASIDTTTGDTVLFGIPRNLENVPFASDNPLSQVYPQGYNCGDKCLINEIWNEGEKHRELFPGDPMPGLTATRLTLSEVLGLNIDYTAVINIRGFSELVDAMGGVDITVKERIPIGGKVANGRIVPGSINGWIEAGPQHLNGYEAMWYSRSRATTDDFNRMTRQRCMVGALVKQVRPVSMLEKYPALAKVAKDNVYTDVPPEHLEAWAELVERMQQGTIRSLPFTNKIVNVVDPDYDRIRAIVQDAILDDPVEGPPPPSDPTTAPAAPAPPAAPGATPSAKPSPKEGLVKVEDAC
ncbi:LCP family protein [Gephyromycinifex aptenodytis]|uniref:LCP family protein n=1 Tax=Gephyromycinifex aptenodytis TaxID=2716227 RepID=UPI001445782C|nr:LCP family protein [Gephyromycinifex aptenodytis]